MSYLSLFAAVRTLRIQPITCKPMIAEGNSRGSDIYDIQRGISRLFGDKKKSQKGSLKAPKNDFEFRVFGAKPMCSLKMVVD